MLGTINILNGHFFRAIDWKEAVAKTGGSSLDGMPGTVQFLGRAQRVSIFLATWRRNSNKSIEVLGHTPEICWHNAGWRQVDSGRKPQTMIEFSLDQAGRGREPKVKEQQATVQVIFDSRTFESPVMQAREFAIWCSFLGGQPFQNHRIPESRLSRDQGVVEIFRYEGRQLIRFMRMVGSRSSVRGDNQFVRLSLLSSGDAGMDEARLRDFAAHCLNVTRQYEP